LFGKLFISPSILNDSLAGQSILGCTFFLFSTLNIPCHYLLACKVSAKKSSDRPQQLLSRQVSKGKGNKSENELLGLRQDKKLLHSKGNSQQNKETTHRMGYLQITLQIKGWYPRCIKNFSNSTAKKQVIKSKNRQKT